MEKHSFLFESRIENPNKCKINILIKKKEHIVNIEFFLSLLVLLDSGNNFSQQTVIFNLKEALKNLLYISFIIKEHY